jgi:hypothetical protein
VIKSQIQHHHDANFFIMSLIAPKRLFHVPSMSTVMYEAVADDVKIHGYVAVSHVWGNQKRYVPNGIGIKDGVTWAIPLSHHGKIGRLVNAMKYHGKKYCWWDILCMPQDNQDEINQEIPLMGDYYAGAEITLVLSTAEYNISDDFWELCKLLDRCEDEERDFTSDEYMWIASCKSPMIDFSKEQWFTRIWTLQETVLSKNTIFACKNGSYLNLTNLLYLTSKLDSMLDMYSYKIFYKSVLCMKFLCKIMDRDYTKMDMKSVMSLSLGREYTRSPDKFYGIFGILGYKDFVVDYNLTPNDLAKKITRYAYSKGDISWMAVGGNSWPGFIQAMHSALYVGNSWKKSSDPCKIIFHDNTLSINVAKFAIVVKHGNPESLGIKDPEIPRWLFNAFRKWEFDAVNAAFAATQYCKIPDSAAKYVYMQICVPENVNLEDVLAGNFYRIYESANADNRDDVLSRHDLDMRESHKIIGNIIDEYMGMYHGANIAKAITYAGEDVALIISGDVSEGDEILATTLRDKDNRILGIVSSGDIRKGVCLIPGIKIPKHLYFTHKFLL